MFILKTQQRKKLQKLKLKLQPPLRLGPVQYFPIFKKIRRTIRLKVKRRRFIKRAVYKVVKRWPPKKRFRYYLFSKVTKPAYVVNPAPGLGIVSHHTGFLRGLYTSLFTQNYRSTKPRHRYTSSKVKVFYTLQKFVLKQKLRATRKKVSTLRQYWRSNVRLTNHKLYRKRLKRWTGRYRRITKQSAYNTAVARQLATLTGLQLAEIKNLWAKIRRNSFTSWGTNSAVRSLATRIALVLPNLLHTLGFVSSVLAGNMLIKSGAVFKNGQVSTRFETFEPGHVLQLHANCLRGERFLYSQHRKYEPSNRLKQVPFIYFDYASLLILLLRYPFPYELLPYSFVSVRWIRYFIRQFAVKNKHYTPWITFSV